MSGMYTCVELLTPKMQNEMLFSDIIIISCIELVTMLDYLWNVRSNQSKYRVQSI